MPLKAHQDDEALGRFELQPAVGVMAVPFNMKVLVIGGGGREHALCWAIGRSSRVSEVVCAPGNGGITQVTRCVKADQKDIDDLLRVVGVEKPDLTVVGPEIPLSLGRWDAS